MENKDSRLIAGLKHTSRTADLICGDFSILPLFYHFGIELGFGDEAVEDTCARYGISADLFISMCKVYTMPGYVPDCSGFGKEDLRVVAEYVHQSHVYYLERALPELDRCLDEVTGYYGEANRKVLKKFYSDYRREVDKHFDYEEKTVLPYVRRLLAGGSDAGYSMADFEDNHTDIEESLEDLKNIIIKYLPSGAPFELRYDLLSDIIRLGRELANHTVIENRILVPIAVKIENDGR